MKKRLLHLIRHAKSDWSMSGQNDFDRPLNERGRRDAPMMADRLFSNFPNPKVFYVSAALRTRQTAGLFALNHANKVLGIHLHQELYHATEDELMEFLTLLPSSEIEVALFTHNNGISEFASRLSRQNIDMPTCAIATFEVSSEWNKSSPNDFMLKNLDYPKQNQ
jgi:phosphohistidine phosphatase